MSERLLVLNYEGLGQNIRRLTDELDSSKAFRDRFLRNPTGIISEYLFPFAQRVSRAEINQANRLLYALLSNDEFIAWAKTWQSTHDVARDVSATELEVVGTRERLYEELADAILRFADRDTIHALLAVDRSEAALTSLEDYVQPQTITAHVRLPPPPKPVVATVLYVVAAAAVAIVILLPLVAAPSSLDRLQLQRLSGTLIEELRSRAHAARQAGATRVVHSSSELDI